MWSRRIAIHASSQKKPSLFPVSLNTTNLRQNLWLASKLYDSNFDITESTGEEMLKRFTEMNILIFLMMDVVKNIGRKRI